MFFDESWNDKVFATSPYTLNTHKRTRNAQDYFVAPAGASAFAKLVYLPILRPWRLLRSYIFTSIVKPLGSSLTKDGLLGYISECSPTCTIVHLTEYLILVAVAVDSTASYKIQNSNAL